MKSAEAGSPYRPHAVTPYAPRLKRALTASLTMTALIGGGLAWQHASSERTLQRAEQARIHALRMTEHKALALEREAAIAAAAQAYAARLAAEKALREMPPVAQTTAITPGAASDPEI